MSAQSMVTDAVLAALNAAPALAVLNRIGSGEAERAPVPYAWLNEMVAGEWGSKSPEGREVVLVLSIADRGDAARLAALCSAAEAALLALPRPLPGWDHAGPRLRRTRSTQRRDGTRIVAIELRLRLLAL